MRTVSTTIATFLLPIFLMASSIETEKIRREFKACVSKEADLEGFLSRLSRADVQSSTVKAYQGAAKAMMADRVSSPFAKYSYFTEGTELLEEAIQADPSNAELRYLRLLIQTNCPSFLGYSENIETDFERIMRSIASTNNRQSWMDDFESYVKSSEGLSARMAKFETSL